MAVVVAIAMMINNDDDKYINRSFIKAFDLNMRDGGSKEYNYWKSFFKRAMAHLSHMEAKKIKPLEQKSQAKGAKQIAQQTSLEENEKNSERRTTGRDLKEKEDKGNLTSFPPTTHGLLTQEFYAVSDCLFLCWSPASRARLTEQNKEPAGWGALCLLQCFRT